MAGGGVWHVRGIANNLRGRDKGASAKRHRVGVRQHGIARQQKAA